MTDEVRVLPASEPGLSAEEPGNGKGQGSGTSQLAPAPGSKGTIAVDMDDVLCQTNAAIVEMHNAMYGHQPPLTLDDFKHYLYWDNRGWGSQAETAIMVTELIAAGLYPRAAPVPGAKEGLLRLKEQGYKLIIITARGEKQREVSEDWLAEHLPDIFDEIHFTGAFVHLAPTHEEEEGHAARKAIVSHVKRTKAEVCNQTNSLLLIDDSSENALSTSLSPHAVPVLLFGDYGWNAAVEPPDAPRHPDDRRVDEGGETYAQKAARGEGALREAGERRQEVIRRGWLPRGVERVRDWEEVVRWVEKWEKGRQGV